MRVFLLTVAMLSLASAARAEDPWKSSAVWAAIGGQAADALSTEYALNRLGPMGREANPIMGQTTAQRLAVKGAVTALEVWVVADLVRHGHGRAAKVIGWTTGASLGAVAAHNVAMSR